MKPALNCTAKALITAAFKAIFLRHGCTECEAEAFEVEPGPAHGGNIALASVRKDGQEIYRVYDLDDLDALLADTTRCSFLARTILRLSRSRYGDVNPTALKA